MDKRKYQVFAILAVVFFGLISSNGNAEPRIIQEFSSNLLKPAAQVWWPDLPNKDLSKTELLRYYRLSTAFYSFSGSREEKAILNPKFERLIREMYESNRTRWVSLASFTPDQSQPNSRNNNI